ncbi:hypothetical protein Tco_1162923 [Tanacetum coccineum]
MAVQLSSAALAMLTTQPACHPCLALYLSLLKESLPYVPDVYAVSDGHGAKTRMHIPAHSGSEAHNGLPNLILPHEPKLLGKHTPPPSLSVLSPDELYYPP